MIYFAFAGTPDDLRASGIGFAGDFEYITFGGIVFGFVHEHSYKARAVIDRLHPALVSLPGVAAGTLQDKHVRIVTSALPNAKKGDAMGTVLSAIYAATSHEGFNPNHH